jgi:hypothetical protein
VRPKQIFDFRKNAYRSAGVPERHHADFVADGYSPFDTLKDLGLPSPKERPASDGAIADPDDK